VRFAHTLFVDRPVDEVFKYVTDPANQAVWQSGCIESRLDGGGPLGPGSRLTEVRSFMGKRLHSTLEVTAYEPARRFDLEVVEGPVPSRVRHRFESADGGTTIRFEGETEPGRAFKLAEPIIVRAVKKQSEADFRRLKQILETGRDE